MLSDDVSARETASVRRADLCREICGQVTARSTLLVEDAQYGEHGSVCAVAVVRAMQHGALLLQGERQQRQQAVGVRPGGQPHAAHVPRPLLSPASRQNCAPGEEFNTTSDKIIC